MRSPRLSLALAQRLKLSVVAEGIETEIPLHQLQTLGCEKGQSYQNPSQCSAHSRWRSLPQA
jgi:EAL domain-containing protein (putative c-di-GMP-specific phosphodiesterase class I)